MGKLFFKSEVSYNCEAESILFESSDNTLIISNPMGTAYIHSRYVVRSVLLEQNSY